MEHYETPIRRKEPPDQFDKLERELDYLRYCAGYETIYGYVRSGLYDEQWLPLVKDTYGPFMTAADFKLALASQFVTFDETTRLHRRT